MVENDENVPIGFCVCWLREAVGHIEPLGIHPDYQGMGLGKALELAVYQTLKNYDARLIKVDHVSLNENAIALSKKTGFRQSQNALRYYVDVKC
jgi:ribosomal protein S18 acetylase RimI-like enzyme